MKDINVEEEIVEPVTVDAEDVSSRAKAQLEERVKSLEEENKELKTRLDAIGTRYNRLFNLYANNLDFYLNGGNNN